MAPWNTTWRESATALLLATLLAGCGTTRWTDTRRTATEQLLISDAIDRAVQQIDFHQLAGADVYFDDSYLSTAVDQDYVISSLRQHLLASGCVLKEKREDARYVVEARAGAIGTDRHDLLYGLPATNLPTLVPIPGVPTALPEIAVVKRTDQLGVAKLAVFAYDRTTGESVWQSGVSSTNSAAKDFWVLGMGPIQRGTIYDGTAFAGQKLHNPLVRRTPHIGRRHPSVPVTAEASFRSIAPQVARRSDAPKTDHAAPAVSGVDRMPPPPAASKTAAGAVANGPFALSRLPTQPAAAPSGGAAVPAPR